MTALTTAIRPTADGEAEAARLTGLTGIVADVIAALGEVGVGALTLLETVVPPVPSEVVLPLAGFLAQQGEMALVGVLVAATLGSLVGAWGFYALGAKLGLDRSIALLARVPLVDEDGLWTASAWFERHGRGSVFFGRLVPGVRSLISLPAGAQRMPLPRFSLWTAAGSGLWNGALVGAGYLLGTRWETVGDYVGPASNIALGLLIAVGVVLLARRALRRSSR